MRQTLLFLIVLGILGLAGHPALALAITPAGAEKAAGMSGAIFVKSGNMYDSMKRLGNSTQKTFNQLDRKMQPAHKPPKPYTKPAKPKRYK
ncbi:MAG: hypothetical protein AB7G80_00650 [Dongiaceae bacterium]